MNKILLISLIFIISTCNAHGQDFIVRPTGTMIEGGRHYLEIKVWNCTNSNVEVPLADLPWGQHRLNLVLYLAGKLAGDPLKEVDIVGDSPSTKTMIKAMGYAEGRVDLDYRFSNIARYAKGGNLLVFWAYDTSLIMGGRSHFEGGMIPYGVPIVAFDKDRIGCK